MSMDDTYPRPGELNYEIYSQVLLMCGADCGCESEYCEHNPMHREGCSNYPEEVYLATMKIMDSYGVDTNKYHRSTINISIINDNFQSGSEPYDWEDQAPIDVAKFKGSNVCALVKYNEYEKFIKPLIPKKEKPSHFNDFSSTTLTDIIATGTNTAEFHFSFSAGPLIGGGSHYFVSRHNNKWKIDTTKGTWIS